MHYGLQLMWTLTFAQHDGFSIDVRDDGPQSAKGHDGVARSAGVPDMRTSERSECGRVVDGWCSCGRPYGLEGLSTAMREGASFVKKLRANWYRGRAFPYVIVPELHKDGHVHLHMAVADFIPFDFMGSLWGHGFVAFTDFRKRKKGEPRGTGGKRSASYLTKYVSKTFDADLGDEVNGRHRYEVAQGFDPASTTVGGFRSREEALDFIRDAYGVSIDFVKWSEDVDPDGPTWCWASTEVMRRRWEVGS